MFTFLPVVLHQCSSSTQSVLHLCKHLLLKHAVGSHCVHSFGFKLKHRTFFAAASVPLQTFCLIPYVSCVVYMRELWVWYYVIVKGVRDYGIVCQALFMLLLDTSSVSKPQACRVCTTPLCLWCSKCLPAS